MATTNNFKEARKNVYRSVKGYDLQAIDKAKVMVIGAGALGNEVLKNLALLNVGHILIIDFDVIEPHNLSRSVLFRQEDCDGKTKKSYTAAQRLKELNPTIKVMVIDGDIAADVGLGIFRRMDSIIGCLDNIIARRSINRLTFKVGGSWIDGGLQDGSGIVASYKDGHACYECTLGDADKEFIRQRFSCPDKIRKYASVGRMPTTPIDASIIGALQVKECMNEINGNEKESILGKSIKYFGSTNELIPTIKAPEHQEECYSTHFYEDIIESKALSANMQLSDFLDWAYNHFKSQNVTLDLEDNYFVKSIKSEKSGKLYDIITPRMAISDDLTQPFKNGSNDVIHLFERYDEIDSNFPYQHLSLLELGIPHLHIINLIVDGQDYYVELTGDEGFLNFE